MNMNATQSFNFLPVPTDIHFGCGILRSAAGTPPVPRGQEGVPRHGPGRSGGRDPGRGHVPSGARIDSSSAIMSSRIPARA